MSGLFGGTPAPPPPDPKIKEAQDRQEARLQAQEEQKMRQIAAQQRARRIGGQRMLLSSDREVPQLGVSSKKTLGG